MKKIGMFLLGLLMLGTVYAGGGTAFGVSLQLDGLGNFWVEQSVPVHESVDVLVGVDFLLEPVSVDGTVGVRYLAWEPEGSDLYALARLGVPLYNGVDGLAISNPSLALGVQVLPRTEPGALQFEVGVTNVVDGNLFSEFPDLYGRLGVSF